MSLDCGRKPESLVRTHACTGRTCNSMQKDLQAGVKPRTFLLQVWGQAKTRRLFARQKISPAQHTHIIRHKSHTMPPARRCGRLMESCSSHMPCCDPCASCRCRLFNTICHCWRINHLCLKRT
ncbi:hypothetical protein AMECASPLE_019891 [Ameca splendens]|uniref:Agouti domain-containing protein n=2 Tax=Goodeidae TaxID=28758 RepID=A0ABV1AAX9_9TELE